MEENLIPMPVVEELARLKNVELFVKDCQERNDSRSILTLLYKIHNTGVRT